ncbi:MAG TPA: nucleoside triphosphate pyrophosphohydrolase [Dehalococcoidia bacterium]|nr:nucleoside triphosphate pyrophosphohydrolase [Dehalococcoidia bacterium]
MLTDVERQTYEELRGIVARLRAPDGCPWDREQTHASLRPHLLQEAYEALAVLDSGEVARLPEELGDVLFQILLHTQLAEEAGEFTMTDVIGGLAAKLVRRHPHVFGDAKVETSDQVWEQWDELKRKERGVDTSALAGVPAAMPALAYANELLSRAERAGFAWPDKRDVIEKLDEELGELENATSKQEQAAELGDILLNVANYARYLGIDAEEALREAGHKFRRRFEGVETRARDRNADMRAMSREALIALWNEAKAATG